MKILKNPEIRILKCPEDVDGRQWSTPYPISYVYVFWGDESRPLYVGMSFDPGYRLAAHRSKPWFPEAHTIWTASVHDDCATTLEKSLIADFNPIHNIRR